MEQVRAHRTRQARTQGDSLDTELPEPRAWDQDIPRVTAVLKNTWCRGGGEEVGAGEVHDLRRVRQWWARLKRPRRPSVCGRAGTERQISLLVVGAEGACSWQWETGRTGRTSWAREFGTAWVVDRGSWAGGGASQRQGRDTKLVMQRGTAFLVRRQGTSCSGIQGPTLAPGPPAGTSPPGRLACRCCRSPEPHCRPQDQPRRGLATPFHHAAIPCRRTDCCWPLLPAAPLCVCVTCPGFPHDKAPRREDGRLCRAAQRLAIRPARAKPPSLSSPSVTMPVGQLHGGVRGWPARTATAAQHQLAMVRMA